MSRTTTCLAAALALHVAALLTLRPPPSAKPLAAASGETTIDLEPLAAEAPVPATTTSPPDTGGAVAEGRVAPPTLPAPWAARSSAPAESAAAPPGPAEAPSAEAGWTFSLGGPAVGDAPLSGDTLAAATRAGVRATLDEERRANAAHAGDPLQRVLPAYTPRDIELGLVPGTELAALTREEIRRSRAPNVGRALLEFQLDGAGVVASVRVLDASSDRADWDEAAAEIARIARARPKVRMPGGSRGLALTVEVTSAIKTASGATPTDSTIAKIARAIDDPVDAIIDGKVPAQRVVAARVVGVEAF
jgi:TonB family protein